MGARADILAGRAFVELFIKDSQLVKGIRSAQRHFQDLGRIVLGVGTAMTGVGTAILAPLGMAVKKFVEFGGTIEDIASRTGVARRELTLLAFAAQQTGTSLEDIEVGLHRQAKGGDRRSLGDIAQEFAKITDAKLKDARAQELWGRSGAKLIPIMDQWTTLMADAERMGVAISDEDIRRADELGDKFGAAKSSLAAMVMQVGAALAPLLIEILDTVTPIIQGMAKWVRDNRELAVTIAAIGAGILAAGVVVAGLGLALMGVSVVLSGIVSLCTLLPMLFAAIVSPVGLVVLGVAAIGVAIVAAAAYWLLFTRSGKIAFSAITAAAKAFGDFLKKVFGGIVDAIKAGDMELAWKIAVEGMKIVWLEFAETVLKQLSAIMKLAAGPGMVALGKATGTPWFADELARGAGLDAELAKKNLDRLRAQAAAAAANAAQSSSQPSLGGQLGPRNVQVLGFNPFSAAAAGNGSTPFQRMLKLAEERNRLAREQAEQMKAMLTALNKMDKVAP